MGYIGGNMTEGQLERRYRILELLLGSKRQNYLIQLDGDFITIRNQQSKEGLYTDSLSCVKQWIKKDIKK